MTRHNNASTPAPALKVALVLFGNFDSVHTLTCCAVMRDSMCVIVNRRGTTSRGEQLDELYNCAFCDRVLFQLFSGYTLLLDHKMGNNDHDCNISEFLSAVIQRHNSAQQGELI